MNARYYGKKTVRNEFGDVVRVMDPVVEVNFTEKEKDKAEKMLDRMREWYTVYVDASLGCYTATIPVCDREDGNDFLKEWKELKKQLKKGA